MRAFTRATTDVWQREVRERRSAPSNENAVVPEGFGQYFIYESLGEGGLATVHRAVENHLAQLRSPTSIALKRLRPELAADWELVNAFLHEARLASELRHDNIAQTHTYGRIDGTYYIAMELVSGPTLQQIMTHSRSAAGAIPLPIVLEILIQLSDALDYVHNQTVRIIHRDVSPTNIIVSRSGRVKLIDFGVAKAVGLAGRASCRVTKSNLGYLAPESALGQLDTRSDLFALGVIGHELLTGRPLARDQRIQPPSRWNPDVSGDLDDIVLTALRGDPAARWQNAAALRFALRAVARKLGIAHGHEIQEWAEWAFTRKPRHDSTRIGRLLEDIEHDLESSSC